jgi:xylulokinase
VARLRDAGPDVTRRLANPLVPGMAGPLLALLTRTRPDLVAGAVAAVQPKDWLRSAVAGPGAVGGDPSDASATLLWDVEADGWSTDAAAVLGIDAALLPPVRPSRGIVGETTGALGLPAGLPVVTGAGDTACAALGTGTLRPGRGQVSIGTGGQILVPLAASAVRAKASPVTHTYRDAADGWYRMGAVQNCGLALERVLGWLGATWPQALASLTGVTSADGITSVADPVFLPHLSGERTPWLDPTMRGAWVGLGLEHDREHLLRAALTGVACSLADAWDAVLATGADPGIPYLVGGGSVDGAWRRLLADVLGTPLRPASAPDAAVVGAAALALTGLGTLTLDEAAAVLDQRAGGGATVEPSRTHAGWVADVRGRFADARERLAAP